MPPHRAALPRPGTKQCVRCADLTESRLLNRHQANLAGELKSIGAQIDIADLRNVEITRIKHSQLVAAVTPDNFPGLDANRVEVEDATITLPSADRPWDT
jgi:hypothetical protein